MSVFNPDWKYANSEESRKPGYLARKFAQIKKEQKAEAETRKHDAGKVKQLKRAVI